jgi:hypothetical protein
MDFPVEIKARQDNTFRLHTFLVEEVYEAISGLETIQTNARPGSQRVIHELVVHELESIFTKNVSNGTSTQCNLRTCWTTKAPKRMSADRTPADHYQDGRGAAVCSSKLEIQTRRRLLEDGESLIR